MNNKIMLAYPPGALYQRGEDRSQGNVSDSISTSMRACNDLGYAAAILKGRGYQVYLRDFQTEQRNLDFFVSEFCEFAPDFLFMSITNATIFDDLLVVEEVKKKKKKLAVALKGALFFDPVNELLEQLPLENIDYLIGGETEFLIGNLADAHFSDPKNISKIPGILFKKGRKWCRNDFSYIETDLDSLPFPDRGLMKNDLYVRPDNREPQATIFTSRGCGAQCTYCLTPIISGKKVRLRSPANIIDEIEECYFKYKIHNFFFKSDTFTLHPKWVEELCASINGSKIAGKINWVANSRARPLERKTLNTMKEAGCWLVAFGFESGSDETMAKINKGASVKDNLLAARFAKEAGLKIYGFFLVGFPWENMSHLQETKRLIYEIDADFIELHMALPYYGTKLHELVMECGVPGASVLGQDYFNPPAVGTKYLTTYDLKKFRTKLQLHYHLRPSFVGRKILDSVTHPKILLNYCRYGIQLLRKSWLQA